MRYPRVSRKYDISSETIQGAVAELREDGESFDDRIDPPYLVREDRDDDYIVALAEASQASYLVTRDTHFDAVDASSITARIIRPEESLMTLRHVEL